MTSARVRGLRTSFSPWIFPWWLKAASYRRLLDDIETTHLKLVETTLCASGIVVNA